ncbi:hypothetical protein ASPTUDRAFT_50011 [Aspergillus tubingensis CBS 134.48]|uniref:Uncharacterized protein n=1 Tax=Aspergillus tubingensis (strain CBS 134.48) TaxID=767770 RepID=A0A1L9NIN6_ASPTC|nr:hypothetical protein ASPTUDRAFT_50011 [Aspergillus tubingensis CBS 134.48]
MMSFQRRRWGWGICSTLFFSPFPTLVVSSLFLPWTEGMDGWVVEKKYAMTSVVPIPDHPRRTRIPNIRDLLF